MSFDVSKWNKQRYLADAGIILESELTKSLNKALPENTGVNKFAKSVADILKSEYGSHNFDKFMDILHSELGIDESVNEVKDDYYPDSPEALSAATSKAREILDKYKSSIKTIADKYEGQPEKSREMQNELNALVDTDLEGLPFRQYVADRVKGALGKALFRYYAQKNPELAKIMK